MEEVERVAQHDHDEDPDDALIEGPLAALQRRPAQDHRRDGGQLVEFAGGGLAGLQAGGKHHACDPGEPSAPHVGRGYHSPHRHAREIGGFPPSAGGVDAPPVGGRVHHEGQDSQQHGGNPNQIMDAEKAAGAEGDELARQTRLAADGGAAGDEKDDAANQNHGAERGDEGIDVEKRDHNPVGEPDRGAGENAGGDAGRNPGFQHDHAGDAAGQRGSRADQAGSDRVQRSIPAARNDGRATRFQCLLQRLRHLVAVRDEADGTPLGNAIDHCPVGLDPGVIRCGHRQQ